MEKRIASRLIRVFLIFGQDLISVSCLGKLLKKIIEKNMLLKNLVQNKNAWTVVVF